MPAKQPSPDNPDGGPWFMIDTKYPTAGNEYVFISADKVAFGVSEYALRHSNTLWHNATTQPDGSGAVFYFHDGAVEHSDAVRLLLDVLGGYRLPHWDDGAWPSSHVLLHTLQLARKYEFDLTYNLIVTFCHLLIDRREKSRHLLDMFRLGAILDDELLATLAISRISEEHGNDVEVSNWSAEQVARIPTAYLWAFIRSVRTRKALGVDGAGNTADATVENVFRASLAEIKAQEDLLPQ